MLGIRFLRSMWPWVAIKHVPMTIDDRKYIERPVAKLMMTIVVDIMSFKFGVKRNTHGAQMVPMLPLSATGVHTPPHYTNR
jgi:hypothetical protein